MFALGSHRPHNLGCMDLGLNMVISLPLAGQHVGASIATA